MDRSPTKDKVLSADLISLNPDDALHNFSVLILILSNLN